MKKTYWPFEVLPAEERDELHEEELAFLEAAHEAGHDPYAFGAGSFGAGTSEDRSVEIIHRGSGRRWELLLARQGEPVSTALLTDFADASARALAWLEGADLEDVRDRSTAGAGPG